jgi:hypothetical protein
MILGVLIFISYTIIAINTRAIAKAQYGGALLSGGLFMCVNFALTRYIVEAKTWTEFLSYLIGGMAGDCVGIYLSVRFAKDTK